MYPFGVGGTTTSDNTNQLSFTQWCCKWNHDPCFLDSNFTIYMYSCFYFCRCCNTCEDVREAYRKKGWAFNSPEGIEQCNREGWTAKMKAQQKEGCQVYGYLEVNKVQGNFHFAPGKSFQQHHVHGRSSSFLLGRELQKALLIWVFKKI